MNSMLDSPRLTRIRLLASVAFACNAAVIAPTGRGAFADQSQVQVEWTIPAPQLTDVQERLALPAKPIASKDGTRGAPLFYLLAGAAALPSVVDAIISAYREVVYGGVVVDACNDRIEIHNDRSIPGKVMVLHCAERLALYVGADAQSPDLIKILSDATAHK